MPLPRILEPEVMDTEKDAVEYDAMDFAEVNLAFAQRALDLVSMKGRRTILDVGTGTARIPILIAQLATEELNIVGVDLSSEMLKVAEKNVLNAGLSKRISLQLVDAKKLVFDARSFDMVISNSLVHHIPEPGVIFSEVARAVKPGGSIFIRDLMRPESDEQLDMLVRQYAGDADEYQQKLFRDSLHAALTIPEVRDLLQRAGIEDARVVQSSDRHWSVEKL